MYRTVRARLETARVAAFFLFGPVTTAAADKIVADAPIIPLTRLIPGDDGPERTVVEPSFGAGGLGAAFHLCMSTGPEPTRNDDGCMQAPQLKSEFEPPAFIPLRRELSMDHGARTAMEPIACTAPMSMRLPYLAFNTSLLAVSRRFRFWWKCAAPNPNETVNSNEVICESLVEGKRVPGRPIVYCSRATRSPAAFVPVLYTVRPKPRSSAFATANRSFMCNQSPTVLCGRRTPLRRRSGNRRWQPSDPRAIATLQP